MNQAAELEYGRAAGSRMIYDATISDMFFNTDHSEAWVKLARDEGGHYDRERIAKQAEVFVGQLETLGVDPRPDAEELTDDFFNRL